MYVWGEVCTVLFFSLFSFDHRCSCCVQKQMQHGMVDRRIDRDPRLPLRYVCLCVCIPTEDVASRTMSRTQEGRSTHLSYASHDTKHAGMTHLIHLCTFQCSHDHHSTECIIWTKESAPSPRCPIP